VERIRTYPGVTRKRRIGAFTSHFPVMPGAEVVAAFGEDCAVLALEGLREEYALLALDAIVPDLLKRAPRFAGYSSVLVNVLDIAAMAGRPVAIVDFVGSVGEKFEEEVAQGMAEGVAHFQVPLVGGHLNPDDPSPSLAVAILGRVPKKDCLFSHTARAGDDLLVAVDLDGRRIKEYPMAWSSLRGKPRVEVLRRFVGIRKAASRGLIHSSKDASNPGIIGTLGMMLEVSGVGGTVELNRIPRPKGIALEDWILMYQGCGFVLSASATDTPELTELLGEYGLTCASVGQVRSARRLDLERGNSSATVFDFTRGGVTGLPPASPS